jgi:DNA-directed RNA polymerase specialized sigma24 family protein
MLAECLTSLPVRWHALATRPLQGSVTSEALEMSSRELSPEWVLSALIPNPKAPSPQDGSELAIAARRLWPRLQVYVRRKLANQNSDEALVLANEVWEGVLGSIAKTLQRSNQQSPQVANLEAYLFGAFQHRFNRALMRERRRQETIKLVPSAQDLERLQQTHDSKSVCDLERSLEIKEVIQNMDEWTRKVWIARQYGYSWREIAGHLGLTEPQAKLRFRYAIRKLRSRLGNGG